MRNRMHHPANLKRIRIPFRFTTAAALVFGLLISVVLCHCSKTVDITIPPDEDGGVSAYGTCIACHSNEEMITLTAKPIPPQGEGGEG